MIKGFIKKILHYKSEDNNNQFIQQGSNTKLDNLRIDVRRPQKTVKNLIIGDNCLISGNYFFELEGAQVEIGSDTFIGNSSFVCSTNYNWQSGANIMGLHHYGQQCTFINF